MGSFVDAKRRPRRVIRVFGVGTTWEACRP